MKADINYSLVGQFKCDIYNSGKLESSTDWFDNFITSTGLMYPNFYAFCDCFRFLSLGNDPNSTLNSGSTSLTSLGTTGLASPITGFYDSNGNVQVPQSLGYQAYANPANNNGSTFCGTVLSAAGPRFYRAWNIPTGGAYVNQPNNINVSGLYITEFMVSPSSGGDPTGQCAFSRVRKSLLIPNGQSAIITYQLQVLLQNTGINIFPSGTFVTGNADVSEDYEIIREWANLSGYYRHIYFGLRAVDTNGITYIPVYGDGMEPASKYVNSMVFYLSPDNTQFDVNPTGGIQTSVGGAYAADGLRQLAYNVNLNVNSNASLPPYNPSLANSIFYNNNPIVSNLPINDPLSTAPSYFRNLRIGDSNNTDQNPGLDNYAVDAQYVDYQIQSNSSSIPVSYATPGASGYQSNTQNFGQLAVVSAQTTQLPINTGVNSGQNLVTGRHKMITRQSIFAPVSSLGWNTRFGSLVYAFWANQTSPSVGANTYYPYIDTMFFDSSGRSTMAHYRFITGIYLTQRGSGILNGYLSLTNGNNIQQYISLQTFQGGFQGSGIYTNPLTILCDTNSPNYNSLYYGLNGSNPQCCSGYVFAGNSLTTLDSYGTTNQTGDNFGNSGSGYGAVYGVVTSDNFCLLNPDLGILDHSLVNNTRTHTGALGWPVVLPFGNPVLVIPTGITYYDTGFASGWSAVIDTGNFFNGTNQIIKQISFTTVNSGNWTPISITGFYPNIPVSGGGIDLGYYITLGAFTGNSVPLTSLQVTSTFKGMTGYYYGGGYNANLQGDTWNGTFPYGTGFSVLTGITTLSGQNVVQVTGLFANIYERGYLKSYPPQDGQPYNMFFSGGGTSSPYYVTNILSGIGGKIITGYSLMSGTVQLTRWCPPTGYADHAENIGISGYGLLPNWAIANYYGGSIYPVSCGGQLPGLSLDNSLQIFLNLNWSAPCSDAAPGSCYQPI